MAKSLTIKQIVAVEYSNPGPFNSRVVSFARQDCSESFHASVYAINMQAAVEENSGKEGHAELISRSRLPLDFWRHVLARKCQPLIAQLTLPFSNQL